MGRVSHGNGFSYGQGFLWKGAYHGKGFSWEGLLMGRVFHWKGFSGARCLFIRWASPHHMCRAGFSLERCLIGKVSHEKGFSWEGLPMGRASQGKGFPGPM